MKEFNRTAEDLLKAAKEARIPEQVQAFAVEGVAQSRKAYDAATAAALEQAKTAEQIFSAVQTGAKSIGDKLISNTTTNVEAFFNAAEELAKATSLPELARLQAEYAKAQMAVAASQTQELLNIVSKVTKSTFTDVQAATTKATEKMRKAG